MLLVLILLACSGQSPSDCPTCPTCPEAAPAAAGGTQLAAWEVATELSPDPPPDGLWDAIDSQLQQETSRTTLEDLTLIVRGLAGEVRDLRASVESLRADLRSEAVEEGPAPRDPLHPRLSVWEEAVSRRSRSGVG